METFDVCEISFLVLILSLLCILLFNFNLKLFYFYFFNIANLHEQYVNITLNIRYCIIIQY